MNPDPRVSLLFDLASLYTVAQRAAGLCEDCGAYIRPGKVFGLRPISPEMLNHGLEPNDLVVLCETCLYFSDAKIREWMIRRLRAITPNSEAEPCFVCQRYQVVTERHHIIPIAGMADFILKYGLYDVPVYMPLAWLCPTHHAILHQLQAKPGQDRFRALDQAHDELEWQRMSEVLSMGDPARLTDMISAQVAFNRAAGVIPLEYPVAALFHAPASRQLQAGRG